MTAGKSRQPAQRNLVLAAGVMIALAITAAALLFSGAAGPRAVADPGGFVRWALPVATMVHYLALSVVLAALVYLTVILPWPARPRTATTPQPWPPALSRVLSVGTVAGLIWTFSAAAVLILGFADTIGKPLSTDEAFTRQLAFYMVNIPSGRAWLSVTILAALTATLLFAVQSRIGFVLTGVLAAFAVVPLSSIGHAAGSTDHSAGVSALSLHLLGVSLWVGGVIVLGLLWDVLPSNNPSHAAATVRIFARFSLLAGAAFALVFVSGVINTILRVESIQGLLSPYGTLIILKTLATVVLGVIGYLHRARITAAGRKNMAWKLIGTEATIMAGVMGIAAVLGRTPPPVPQQPEPDITETEILTGYPLPPELSALTALTQWRWDLFWVSVAVIAAWVYLAASRRAASFGVQWSKRRIFFWLTGLGLLVYATSGAPAVYGLVLLSAHLTMLLTLGLVVPLLLVSARPAQLLKMTVPVRADGSTGVREWALQDADHPLLARRETPFYAAVALLGSLLLVYGTNLFTTITASQLALQITNGYLLCLGLVLFGSLLHQVTPRMTNGSLAPVLAALSVTLAAAFLAVFPDPLQADWFSDAGRSWGSSLVEDQRLAAAMVVLLAGTGPLLASAIILIRRQQRQAPTTASVDR